MRSPIHRATSLMAVVAVVGCSNRDSGHPANSEPGHSAATGSPAVHVPEDRSLEAIEYVRLGVPAHDRTWGGDDMARAATVLSELAVREPGRLPRYKSARSGLVLDRITSEDNLKMYRSANQPVQARLGAAIAYFESLHQMFKLYVSALAKKEIADSEAVELMGAVLRAAVLMTELMEEFVPTLDRNDPTYASRMNGISTMKRGLATVIAGALTTLNERHTYRAIELNRLVGYLRNTLPQLLGALTETTRLEIRLRVEGLSNDPAMADLQPGLRDLVSAVHGPAAELPHQ